MPRPVDRRRRRPGVWIAGLVAAAGAAAAWLFWPGAGRLAIDPNACSGCNVLLITIDTLRLDRVGAFGGRGGLTPSLDGLAAEGLRLTRTYASAPLTLPSHASILTATSPPLHGVRANGLFRLGNSQPTLSTVLKHGGYRTGAFVGSFVLERRFGLNRGFDVYDDRLGPRRPGEAADLAERRAEDVVKPAVDWILHPPTDAKLDAPFFAWVHLYDPHEPYRAPEPYASRHAPYDAEVAYTDAMVGRLLDALRDAGRLDRTLIAVAADHGESLGEHGERTHGVFAYDVTMRVPWILWAGARLHGTSDALVRLIDLAPTVLDLVGVSAPPEFEGRSVLTRFQGDDRGIAYMEAMDANLTRNWAPLTSIVSGRYKLIDLPIPELYDLAADPGETSNLFPKERERARTLESLLAATTRDFSARGSSGERTALSSEARQRLQALGYVAAEAPRAPRVYGNDDDPKRLIGAANELNDALARFKAGDQAAGIAAARRLADAFPHFNTASGVLAAMYHDSGALPEAVATLESLVRRAPVDQSVLTVLGGYLLEAGDLQKASGLLEAVTAAHPEYPEAFNTLGVVYSRMGRHDRARAAFARVLELDPGSASAYENRGIDEAAQGNSTAAVSDLRQAIALDAGLASAHNALAAVLLRSGDRTDALDHWRQAIELNPRLYDALYNLATVLYESDPASARPYLTRFVNEAPPSRYAGDIERLRHMLER